MHFNPHSNLAGRHAFLSASQYSWVNYDEDHLIDRFSTFMAASRGTELHELAHRLIRLKVKLPKSSTTLNMYVNDAIGFRMTPEQPLFVSDNCFGTADSVSFRTELVRDEDGNSARRNVLRIADLKTGVVEAKVTQLEVYAAMFCLEYRFNPFDIEIELRIYQSDERRIYVGDPAEIIRIMEQIKLFDKRLTELRMEALG